jgi:hypothetical protein
MQIRRTNFQCSQYQIFFPQGSVNMCDETSSESWVRGRCVYSNTIRRYKVENNRGCTFEWVYKFVHPNALNNQDRNWKSYTDKFVPIPNSPSPNSKDDCSSIWVWDRWFTQITHVLSAQCISSMINPDLYQYASVAAPWILQSNTYMLVQDILSDKFWRRSLT